MIPRHPEWFYWIRRDVEERPAGASPEDPRYYGPPPFSEAELAEMKGKVEHHALDELPPPPWWYRDLFTEPPQADHIEKEPDGRYVGTLKDGRKVHVPGAFADWPPDDFQPPWTDVTYLRVYDDPRSGPSFNYVAYNTIRMYDSRLARAENANTALWTAVRGILPDYQRRFGIDGCMVDMGHALPPALMQGIVEEARRGHPDFALLSENFVIDEGSVRTGYNAVLGYQFRAVESADEMRRLIARSCLEGLPLPAFGSGETHNTPRVAMRDRGPAFCLALWMVNCFLADTIPFIHAGFELGEEAPVNLGLAFTPEEVARLQGTPLGLFDLTALHWDRAALLPLEFARVGALRQQFSAVARARGDQAFRWLDVGDNDVIAFQRTDPVSGHSLVIVADWRCKGDRKITLPLAGTSRATDLLTHHVHETPDGRLDVHLGPGQGLLLQVE